MTEISHNPSSCCATCDDFFNDCLSCDGSLMTLEIVISGAPSPDIGCGCPAAEGALYHRRNILWDNLNGSFKLVQESPFSTCFRLNLITSCAAARDCGACLIEDSDMGCCDGSDYQPTDQEEVYLSSIGVCIQCSDNRMRIASLDFSVCSCERHITAVGPPPVWSNWSCTSPLTPYPDENYPFTCGLGDQIKTAVPCSSQQMECELLWNTPTTTTLADPCGFAFPCDDPEPIVGHLTARLGCN